MVNYNPVKLSSVAWEAVDKKKRVASSVSFCSIFCHAIACFAFKYDDAEEECLMTENYVPIATTSSATELFRHENPGRFSHTNSMKLIYTIRRIFFYVLEDYFCF